MSASETGGITLKNRLIFAKNQKWKNIHEYVLGFRRTTPCKQLHQQFYSSLILLSTLLILLYSQCNWNSDLWQQLGLASALESILQDNVYWGKKALLNFNTGKTQLV